MMMAIESGVGKNAFNGLAKRVRLLQEKVDLLESKHAAGSHCSQIPVAISIYDALFESCHSFAPGVWIPLVTQVVQTSCQKRVRFAGVGDEAMQSPEQPCTGEADARTVVAVTLDEEEA